MAAGEPAAVDEVRPLLEPMCREIAVCGAVPRALYMKLAVDAFGNALVACRAEAVPFAALQARQPSAGSARSYDPVQRSCAGSQDGSTPPTEFRFGFADG